MEPEKNKKEKEVSLKQEKKLTAEGWKRRQEKEQAKKMNASNKKNTT